MTSASGRRQGFARVLRRIFANLRKEVGARGVRDVGELLVDEDFCKEILLMFSSVLGQVFLNIGGPQKLVQKHSKIKFANQVNMVQQWIQNQSKNHSG